MKTLEIITATLGLCALAYIAMAQIPHLIITANNAHEVTHAEMVP